MFARFLRWLLGIVEPQTVIIITIEVESMSPALQALADKVHANTSLTHSVLTLVQGLSQQLRDAKDDPAAISALADEVDSNSTALASAVAANTINPAPVVVPPAPVTEPAPATAPTEPAAAPTDPTV